MGVPGCPRSHGAGFVRTVTAINLLVCWEGGGGCFLSFYLSFFACIMVLHIFILGSALMTSPLVF